ncbi:MAG: hypothetical protein AB7K68_05715 [Bacteriovoracia bacterium]
MKKSEIEIDDEWDGMNPEQKETILLAEMFHSALCELSELNREMPTDREIFDHLFKGNRQYKEVRRLEERLKDVILAERLHLLGILQ